MNMTIGQLEQKLLKVFPAQDACDWDITGVSVGNTSEEIIKIMIALDPTVQNVRRACDVGANLLLTHHPAFLEPPKQFLCADSPAQSTGAVIYHAAHSHVALMNFHTALDFNPLGYMRVPDMLGFKFEYLLDTPGGAGNSTGKNGYGAVCEVCAGVQNVRDVANKCVEVFGEHVRVYGNLDAPVRHVAWGQGSAGCLVDNIMEASFSTCPVDCLIAGEMKYNPAMDLAAAGVPVVLLGHDISEQPFVDLLYEQVISVGIPKDIVQREYVKNWTTV